jgi:DNA-binding LacI/PurR family transcriptional regulator
MPISQTLTEKFTKRLRDEIRAGRWKNQALPSERVLSERFDISRVTVRRSLKQLCAESLVEARPGKGYFVIPGADEPAPKVGGRVVLFVSRHVDGQHVLDALHAGILNGAMDEAHRSGLELYATSQTPAGFRRTLVERWGQDLRGVLLDAADPGVAEFLLKSKIPFVVVETELEGLPVTTVIQDNVGGVRLGLDLLAACGHERIAMVITEEESVHPEQRLAGYREWLLQRGVGLNPAWEARGSNDQAGGREAAAGILDATERPTAFFVGNREMLGGVVEELSRRGLRYPADVALVVWGPPGADEPSGGLSDVTFVNWSREEMGRLAMRALEERVKAGRPERMAVRIPAVLVDRGSAGARRQQAEAGN